MKLTAYDKLMVILGVLLIAFMLIATVGIAQKGGAGPRAVMVKIAFLALDAIVIYYAINRMILRKKEK